MPDRDKDNWRFHGAAQGTHATQETWARVRALHTAWQIDEPDLRIGETANRLLNYALEHALDIRELSLREGENVSTESAP